MIFPSRMALILAFIENVLFEYGVRDRCIDSREPLSESEKDLQERGYRLLAALRLEASVSFAKGEVKHETVV